VSGVVVDLGLADEGGEGEDSGRVEHRLPLHFLALGEFLE
jgi:hypothetical protein